MSKMRLCRKCDLWKDESMFTKVKSKSDGLNSWCRDCTRARSKLSYLNNREKIKKQVKEYRNTPQGRKVQAKASVKYDKTNPKKYVAHWAVYYLKKHGVIKVEPCQVCGEKSVHAHHDDYDRPYDVMWLCPQHHKERHAVLAKAISAITNKKDND